MYAENSVKTLSHPLYLKMSTEILHHEVSSWAKDKLQKMTLQIATYFLV